VIASWFIALGRFLYVSSSRSLTVSLTSLSRYFPCLIIASDESWVNRWRCGTACLCYLRLRYNNFKRGRERTWLAPFVGGKGKVLGTSASTAPTGRPAATIRVVADRIRANSATSVRASAGTTTAASSVGGVRHRHKLEDERCLVSREVQLGDVGGVVYALHQNSRLHRLCT
jgi:hypothetical protein